MLQARFAAAGDQSLQCASVPEHAPSPPLALPPACLHASGLDGDWPQGGPPRGDEPALRDSCPAVSETPRFASDAPLRPVAGSAEWPLSRSGQPRPMLQIPDTFSGATGRYCDADLLSTPGAALPSASPGPATSDYSDGVNMASFCSRTCREIVLTVLRTWMAMSCTTRTPAACTTGHSRVRLSDGVS